MLFPEKYATHKGFSLIELLIVILIISIVYFMGFDGITLGKKKVDSLTPLNLKTSIISSELFGNQATFLCINKCRTCYIREDISSGFTEYTSPINLDNITAYTLDRDDTLTPIQYERYQDQQICLIMHFYPNQSSTQLILEQVDKSYFLPSFFDHPKEFSSLSEAKEYWLKHSTSISNSGDFY